MAHDDPKSPDALDEEAAAVEAIEGRLVAVNARLELLLQMIADGRPIGGALVGRDAPWTKEAAQEFEDVVKGHTGADGALWDKIRDAGFVVVDLPESLYGALTPETR